MFTSYVQDTTANTVSVKKEESSGSSDNDSDSDSDEVSVLLLAYSWSLFCCAMFKIPSNVLQPAKSTIPAKRPLTTEKKSEHVCIIF